MDRPCPEDRSIPVREAFAQENLLPLPDTPYPTDERVEVRIGKTPYARFDRNDYSVPHTQVQRILTVVASPTMVRILEGAEEVACHPRSYDKGQQIEQPEHLEALVQIKRQARRHRGQDRLTQAAPSSQRLLTQAAERGDNLGSITASLLRLLEDYGARCPPWRAKRRRVVPGSREATRDTRRAEGAKGDPKGASERGVQSYGRPVCSRNELAMLWRNAG